MATVKVFFHDACFDGTASAALFGAFYRDQHPGAQVIPIGLEHKLGDPFEGVPLDGDDNACVDFRYTADPRLRWWFDHHATAFQPPSLRADFLARADHQMAFDPAAPSCTGLIARSLAAHQGWTVPAHLAELVRWADIIDAAAYPDAATACSLATPAQRLALWVGEVRDPALIARYIAALGDHPLDELVAAPWIQPVLAPALARRAALRDTWARAGRVHGDVVVFDLADHDVPAPGFSGYDLFPGATYTVTLTRTPSAVKVGVGWNPWGGRPRRHDVGRMCESYGGGGHAAVGGVTLPAGDLDRGRVVVEDIVSAIKE